MTPSKLGRRFLGGGSVSATEEVDGARSESTDVEEGLRIRVGVCCGGADWGGVEISLRSITAGLVPRAPCVYSIIVLGALLCYGGLLLSALVESPCLINSLL